MVSVHKITCRLNNYYNKIIATICSIHFEEDCFENTFQQQMLNHTPKNFRNLKSNAIPTLHLPGKCGSQNKEADEARNQRCKKRKCEEEIIPEFNKEVASISIDVGHTEEDVLKL